MNRSAIISQDGLHRYELRREWARNLPPFVAGMLNPSKADAEVDDPTITRVVKRALSLGCGSIIVWNLGAGRATDPDDWKKMADPLGPENATYIRCILSECRRRSGIAFVGWGNHGSYRHLDLLAIQIAQEVDVELKCLGVTKSGQPKHPLYISAAQELVPWVSIVDDRKRKNDLGDFE